jgi:hypothetical protein
MRLSKWLLLVVFVVALSSMMHAISDPRLVINEPPCSGGEGETSVGTSFEFTSDQTFYTFCNDSGETWTTLLISFDASGLTGADIFCGGNAFQTCDVYQDGVLVNSFSNETCIECEFLASSPSSFSPLSTAPPDDPHFDLYFTASEFFPGIPSSNEFAGQFTIDLDCHGVQGCTNFAPGILFTANANVPPPVPEPATLALFAGAGIPVLVRRWRKRNE